MTLVLEIVLLIEKTARNDLRFWNTADSLIAQLS